MPYKDPEVYREYMRAYRRKQRERKPTRKPNISETPIPKADPEHVRRLRQAEGGAVATPEGQGSLLHVSDNYAIVVVAGTTVRFPCEQVGVW